MDFLQGRLWAAFCVAFLFGAITSIPTHCVAEDGGGDPPASRDPCELGYYLLERGEIQKALEQLDAAVKSAPRQVTAYSYRALARIKNHELKAALADAETAVATAEANVKAGRPSAAAQSELALAYIAKDEALCSLWSEETGETRIVDSSNELELAIAACEEGLRLDPRNVTLYFHRAYAFSRKGEWAKCEADYSKVIAIEPRSACAYTARGHARMIDDFMNGRIADLDEAIRDFDKAIAISPKNAQAHLLRGFARIENGPLDKAFADFEEALRTAPGCTSGWDVMMVLVCSDKWDSLGESLSSLDSICRMVPKDAGFLLMRGQSHFLNGDVEKALADCDAAEKLNVPPEYRSWVEMLRPMIALVRQAKSQDTEVKK